MTLFVVLIIRTQYKRNELSFKWIYLGAFLIFYSTCILFQRNRYRFFIIASIYITTCSFIYYCVSPDFITLKTIHKPELARLMRSNDAALFNQIVNQIKLVVMTTSKSDRFDSIASWLEQTGVSFSRFNCANFDDMVIENVSPYCTSEYIRPRFFGHISLLKHNIETRRVLKYAYDETDTNMKWVIVLEDDAEPLVRVNDFKKHLVYITKNFEDMDIVFLDLRSAVSSYIGRYTGAAGILYKRERIPLIHNLTEATEEHCKLTGQLITDQILDYHCRTALFNCINSPLVRETGSVSIRLKDQ